MEELMSSKINLYKDENTQQRPVLGINRYIIFASIIGVLNVLFFRNYVASLSLVMIELGILAYFFFKNDITSYLGCYLMFLCLSFEFGAFAGVEEFYGFKNFRILGMNLGIICLIPIATKLIFSKINLTSIKKFSQCCRFISLMLLAGISGVIIGLFNLLVNDNNIQNIPNYINIFVVMCYEMVAFPFLLIASCTYILLFEPHKIDLLKQYLVGILVGGVCAMIASLMSGNLGRYGGLDTLLAPMITWYVPFIIFMFFSNFLTKSKYIILLAGIVGTYLLFIFNASGKLFFVVLLLPLMVIIALKKQKRFISLLLLLATLFPFIIGVLFILNAFKDEYVLFSIKLNQASSLLSIWDPDWLNNLPDSPKYRVTEFLNICYEYLKKPWYLLLGKGYMGTIQDHISMFHFTEGAFSDEQWVNGSFYNLHAAINTLFLSHGILGLGIYLYYAKLTLTKMLKTQWGMIGAYWFLICYGYSVTLTAFGLMCLIFSLYELDNQYLAGKSELNVLRRNKNECAG